MALNHELAEAFYLIILEEEGTDSVEAIRNNALAKIEGGEGKTLVSSSINGKSFSYQINGSAIEVLAAASRAIRRYNRGLNRSSTLDFSCL